MLIELGYQFYIHACSGNYLRNIFLLFFPLFFIFLVKRPDNGFGCPDGRVDSSGRPFFLSGRACLFDLLRGTTSGRLFSFVRTVNPVGLNHILPGATRHFLFSLCFVCCLVFFPCDFYA